MDIWTIVSFINTYILVFSGAYLCFAVPLYLLGFFYQRLWSKILGVPYFAVVGFIGSFLVIMQYVTISPLYR